MSTTVFMRRVTKIGLFDVDFQGLKFPKSDFGILPNIGDKRYVCYDEQCNAEVMKFDDVWGSGYARRVVSYEIQPGGLLSSSTGITEDGVTLSYLPYNARNGTIALPQFVQPGWTYVYSEEPEDELTFAVPERAQLTNAQKILNSVPPALRSTLPGDNVEAALEWAVRMMGL